MNVRDIPLPEEWPQLVRKAVLPYSTCLLWPDGPCFPSIHRPPLTNNTISVTHPSWPSFCTGLPKAGPFSKPPNDSI